MVAAAEPQSPELMATTRSCYLPKLRRFSGPPESLMEKSTRSWRHFRKILRYGKEPLALCYLLDALASENCAARLAAKRKVYEF